MLLWPVFWLGIKSKNVAVRHAKEAQRSTRFWKNIEALPYLSKYLEAAKQPRYNILGADGEVVRVFLERHLCEWEC